MWGGLASYSVNYVECGSRIGIAFFHIHNRNTRYLYVV